MASEPALAAPAGTDFAHEYDVRAWVPDFTGSLAEWTARAGFARATHPGLFDLRYGPAEAETLDLFLPSGLGPHPLLVFLHGGFWRRLHKDDFSWVAPPYVDRGVAVAVVNYGLAPGTTLEDIVGQVRRSLVWLYRSADRYGIDRRRIVVGGHSAGGHLACMALATDWSVEAAGLPSTMLAAGFALSPLADLAPLAAVPALHADLDFNPSRIADLSPCRLSPATSASVLGAVGGRESPEFHRQLGMLARTWAPVWGGTVSMPDDDHLSLCDAFATPSSPLFGRSLALLRGLPG